MYKIMIIEDDFSIVQAMKHYIESWGYEAYQVEDFKNVTKDFVQISPHLLLIDIMLPFFNGYHWCTEIRRISNVPIIFISSASDNMNIVMAMNMGADDFIPKPLDLSVLIAKIQALLRRTYDMKSKLPALEHRGVLLNMSDNSVIHDGERIELTKNEYRILYTLMENKGKIVSRDKLMMNLWQNDCYVEENTLTVNVNRLRKKLEKAGLNDFIVTKIGSGYIVE